LILTYKTVYFVGLYCHVVKKNKILFVKASKEEAHKHIAEFKDGT